MRIPKLRPEDTPTYKTYKLRKLTEKTDYVFLYFGIGGYFMFAYHLGMLICFQRLSELPHIAILGCLVIPVTSKAKLLRTTWLYNTIALMLLILAQILNTATSLYELENTEGDFLLDPITYPLTCVSFVLINCTYKWYVCTIAEGSVLLFQWGFLKAFRYLKTAKNSNKRLASLVEDILDLTRLEAGQFNLNVARFSISEIVNELQDQFSDLLTAKGLQLFIEVDDEIKR